MPNRVWLTSLTQHLIESLNQSGKMGFPTGLRYRAEQCLEHTLVNPQALHDHIGVLFALLSPNFPSCEVLSHELRDKILVNRLGDLSEPQLAQLIVNPMALMGLAHDIERFAPASWLQVVEREVQCDIRRKQRKHRHLQQLILSEGIVLNEREPVCGSRQRMDEK